jgi:hypothetical protein
MTSSSPPSVSPGEGGVNPDDVTLVGVCERGAVSCSGAALELCVAGGRWITSDICGSPALCQTQPPGCRPPECALDQRSCDGAVLRVCNAARDGWEELERCVSAAHCNPSAPECLAAPCSAGELSCNGNQLQRCADDQLGWVVLDTCETAALCEAAGAAESSACVPPACEAGARRCVEGNLERCNEGRTAFERVERVPTMHSVSSVSKTATPSVRGRAVIQALTSVGARRWRFATRSAPASKTWTAAAAPLCAMPRAAAACPLRVRSVHVAVTARKSRPAIWIAPHLSARARRRARARACACRGRAARPRARRPSAK